MTATVAPGNLLGNARAEADERMLNLAFVKTHDFRALVETMDFNFVVGRRGTGKTALFRRVKAELEDRPGVWVAECRPEEHEAAELVARLEARAASYPAARAEARLLWRATLLREAAARLAGHWKIKGTTCFLNIQSLLGGAGVPVLTGFRECSRLLAAATKRSGANATLSEVAEFLRLRELEDAVKEACSIAGWRLVVMFDGLDEGWSPTPVHTGALGGLALAVADLRDHEVPLHGILFLRDNAFRALAGLDPDFSRHIEGSTIRLHWDEDALFNLVAERLRHALKLEALESRVKLWNRFAQRDLGGREGFRRALNMTLYRPRDIIVLLNRAYLVAARAGRSEIVESDLESGSREVSADRLADLLSEYATVFPGLTLLCDAFQGRPSVYEYESVLKVLDIALASQTFADPIASDFGVFGTSEAAFRALYSVGFLGIRDATGGIRFCHDGARSSGAAGFAATTIVVHPCYWRALGTRDEELPAEVAMHIYDDYEKPDDPDTPEMRTRLVGQLVDELPVMPLGTEGAAHFEEWVLRSVKILFAGDLMNPDECGHGNRCGDRPW